MPGRKRTNLHTSASYGLNTEEKNIHLPIRNILYTPDTIGVMLELTTKRILTEFLFFEGRSNGACPRYLMTARNIAPPDSPPDWRITEGELIRWMRHKGFVYYRTGTLGY